jgi:stringent starvation protein B
MSFTQATTSTRPYLIRALYEWCTNNGLTPYIAVAVDDSVQVPREYVQQGEIVLNISFDATSALDIGNDFIAFKARFGGVPRQILVPVSHVIAIYARENGEGMAFPSPSLRASSPSESTVDEQSDPDHGISSSLSGTVSQSGSSNGADSSSDDSGQSKGNGGSRPSLRRIK